MEDLFKAENNIEEMLVNKASKNLRPISGSLELLPLCNMNCDMCYVRLTKTQMEKQGRMKTCEEWLELGKQMQKSGVLFLMITGGEPLLFPDFKKLYLGLQELGMIITINTNGTLINEEWAMFFKEHQPRRINITLYGADDKAYQNLCHYRGGFNKAVRAIKLLRENGVMVKVNGSLVKENYGEEKKIIKIAKDLDAAVNIDTYMYPATRERNKPYDKQARLNPKEAAKAKVEILQLQLGKEAFQKYAMNTLYALKHTPVQKEEVGHVKCRAGHSSFIINWQGQMRPCIMLKEPSVDVFEMDFEAAWQEIVKKTIEIELSPKCTGCKFRHICTVCAASALYDGGSFDATPEYLCEYTKSFVHFLERNV